MADFFESILKSVDFVGIIDFVTSNLVWICAGAAFLVALLLGVGLFKDRRRWIWRSILMVAAVLAVLIGVHTTDFYNAYTDFSVDSETGQVVTLTDSASRYAIGHDQPDLARAVEHLIIKVEDQPDWKGSGFFEWEKTYSDETGSATMTRHIFTTTIEVKTEGGVWTASELFGRVDAEISYQ